MDRAKKISENSKTQRIKIENGIVHGGDLDLNIDEGQNNIGKILLDHMKKNPDFVAQVDAITDKENTFKLLVDQSIRCALWLRKQNVKVGDIVGICTHNRLEQIVPALACLYIGATINGWWDHQLSSSAVRHILELTDTRIVFVSQNHAQTVAEGAKEVKVDLKIVLFENDIPDWELNLETLMKMQDSFEVQNFQCTQLPTGDVPAVIVYTSGSTNLPKGVVLSHKTIFANLILATRSFDICRNGLWYSSMCWIMGIILPLVAILKSTKRIIDGQFTAEGACAAIDKYKVEYLMLVSHFFHVFVHSKAFIKLDGSCVRRAGGGGSPITEKVLKRLRKKFQNAIVAEGYGMTEVGGFISAQASNDEISSAGILYRSRQMKVVDPKTGKILGPNEIGEGYFKSPFMMTEYLKDPEATKKAIDADGWYHSGDLLSYDEKGTLFIVGRVSDQFYCRGNCVTPSIIEKLIQEKIEGVIAVAVVPVVDSVTDLKPLAFIVKEPGSNITEEKIMDLVEKNLPEYMKLRGVEFLIEMPRNTSGKIHRTELKTKAQSLLIR